MAYKRTQRDDMIDWVYVRETGDSVRVVTRVDSSGSGLFFSSGDAEKSTIELSTDANGSGLFFSTGDA